jgi:uncharacterized protein DUF1998
MRPVRRSQLISPWGVGVMVNFPNDESLMTCGLDVWPFAERECPPEFEIIEERLQNRLGVAQLRLPPDYRIPGPGVRNSGQRIPFVRFPRWHYCPRCGNAQELGLFNPTPQRCDAPNYAEGLSCRTLPERKRPRLLPANFVAVCGMRAHVQDFPFMQWVHRDTPQRQDCRLRLRSGRSAATLISLVIHCSCGQSQSLAGAFGEDALTETGIVNVPCGGQQPWLGDTDYDVTRCGGPLRVVQRGASNVYFPHVASSIYLPLWGEGAKRAVVEALEDPSIWDTLTQGLVDGKIDLERCKIICGLQRSRKLDPNELREAAQKRLDGIPDSASTGSVTDGKNPHAEEEVYRQAEYDALRAGRGGVQTDLYATVRSVGEYGEPVQEFFSTITCAHKLRETRALYGFSRFLPDDGRAYKDQIADLRLNPSLNWLPAVVVRGEGIFFELKDQQMKAWLQHEDVKRRAADLAGHYNEARNIRGQRSRSISAKFLLLHTLAHLFINQLSFECGYGSSSLRERIYCDSEFPNHAMSGFMIYTASGDAEGTMGGLVRQGQPERIEPTLLRALRKAAWCSYDPICMESVGQGPDSCNLAACHGCAILPETSCEEGNRLLDRVMVVGTPDHPRLGLFGQFVQSTL